MRLSRRVEPVLGGTVVLPSLGKWRRSGYRSRYRPVPGGWWDPSGRQASPPTGEQPGEAPRTGMALRHWVVDEQRARQDVDGDEQDQAGKTLAQAALVDATGEPAAQDRSHRAAADKE